MQQILGRAPLIFAIAVVLSFIFCFGGLYISELEEAYVGETNCGDTPLKTENILQQILAENQQSENGGTSLQVSASSSDAIGKIYEQFLSPYSAKLQYDGVYIKNSTGLDIDLKSELASPPQIKIQKTEAPEVLIVHTHTTESYMMEDRNFYTASDNARSTDNSRNMVKVGECMAETLRKGGISVIHDTTQHDYPSYTGSYSRAKSTISEYLKKYPSIKIVIDLHRDAVSSNSNKTKPTVKVDGQKAAQVMLVVGSETGGVTDFPNWKQNFRLAVRFQQRMEKMYPGLARAMLFSSSKYNMNLTNGSMLLEVGTDANTLDEACYSARLAGNALIEVLNGLR